MHVFFLGKKEPSLRMITFVLEREYSKASFLSYGAAKHIKNIELLQVMALSPDKDEREVKHVKNNSSFTRDVMKHILTTYM